MASKIGNIKCAGCLTTINSKEVLKCSECDAYFDLICANVSEKRFYNTMTKEHKSKWKCQLCITKRPRGDNTNTPVRTARQEIAEKCTNAPSTSTTADTSNNNITQRRKGHKNESENESYNSLDVDDLLGETQHKPIDMDEDILDKFGRLLDTKLEKIKQSIVQELKESIWYELNKPIEALKEDVSAVKNEQKELKEGIEQLNKKIKVIEKQLQKINKPNKIVLYGLYQENYNETEDELFNRVTNVFYEILELDVNPFIEEIRRIGNRGNKKPIEIELISKRMTRYILKNKHWFKNTGLAVGEYVEGEELEQRNIISRKLKEARRNGQHAYVKNNKLFVNGKEIAISTNIEVDNKDQEITTVDLPTQDRMQNTIQKNTHENNKLFR